MRRSVSEGGEIKSDSHQFRKLYGQLIFSKFWDKIAKELKKSQGAQKIGKSVRRMRGLPRQTSEFFLYIDRRCVYPRTCDVISNSQF